MRTRSAGVLLHPTMLPGPFGVGDLGPQCLRFLDWAASAGQTLWQILPLGPTGYGNSPYGALSVFAGNPLLIAPEVLLREGLLDRTALDGVPSFDPRRVQFVQVSAWKEALLRRAWERFRSSAGVAMKASFAKFEEGERHWLDDWALFLSLKRHFGGKEWISWDPPLARHQPKEIEKARASLREEISYHKFVQFVFFGQWDAIRTEAAARGIRIMGDIPMYVAYDSVDVWANPELFLLDQDRRPIAVSGVPPDYFSATGQLWGNPLYRWDVMAGRGYRWWISRMRANLRMADLVRVDHFRAFASYWQVPAAAENAVNGSWEKGPGLPFFEAMRRELGSLPLVAEDLGLITDDVEELRDAAGLPGMRVLQFGFGEIDSPHLPHRFAANSLVYTGTHDNDTTRGWFDTLSGSERELASEYLGEAKVGSIVRLMIRAAYESVADMAIIPIQDILGEGSDSRMNVPGQSNGNWGYRCSEELFRPDRADALRRLAVISGRLAVS